MELISFDPSKPESSLLWILKNRHPKPAIEGNGKPGNDPFGVSDEVQRTKPRKSAKNRELRDLVQYFRERGDAFSLWIAGYLLVASRIGWRPGEILVLRRDGDYIRAEAEKTTNGRGLTDTCEIDIGAYPAWLKVRVDDWIADRARWESKYGGSRNLLTNINARLATACQALGIARISTYTLRHFAIACMKKSGLLKIEIAVLLNHASDRTANERYGKGRSGIKRAREMLRYDKSRLLLVRQISRGGVRQALAMIAAKLAENSAEPKVM